MRIEEYLETLPKNLLNGEDILLPKKTLRDIFRFVELDENDIFYHLGCGNEEGIEIALKEFKVKKAIGIDNNSEKIQQAKKKIEIKNLQGQFICKDVIDSEIEDASVILFWFTEEEILKNMMPKFEKLNPQTRIVTIWGALPGCLPNKVNFPFIINKIPFKKAQNMREQVLAIFGVKCIDFVTAWEFAERYTKSIGNSETKNDRFLTIIQTLTIWINAKNMGVACDKEIPESIKTYIKIMKMNFDIDFEYLLKE